jgi:high-affinity iron transporter
VLFYVSYWLISKSEARRWQEFLTRQVGHSISTGSKWAIGAAAFLAVYREGAETILMFQPMLVNPQPNELPGVVAGVFAAAVALAAVFWGLRFASFRLAIRPFFRVTGALLFVLAVVFAGKAITELQEARRLSISPLPDWLHNAVMAIPHGLRDAFGIAPTVQSIAIQSTILAGAVISLVAIWLVGRFTPLPQPAPVANSTEPVLSKSAV